MFLIFIWFVGVYQFQKQLADSKTPTVNAHSIMLSTVAETRLCRAKDMFSLFSVNVFVCNAKSMFTMKNMFFCVNKMCFDDNLVSSWPFLCVFLLCMGTFSTKSLFVLRLISVCGAKGVVPPHYIFCVCELRKISFFFINNIENNNNNNKAFFIPTLIKARRDNFF